MYALQMRMIPLGAGERWWFIHPGEDDKKFVLKEEMRGCLMFFNPKSAKLYMPELFGLMYPPRVVFIPHEGAKNGNAFEHRN